MKKIIILSFLFMCILESFGKIKQSQNSEGTRRLWESTWQHLCHERGEFGIVLDDTYYTMELCVNTDATKTYLMTIRYNKSTKWTFNKGQKLVFKFENGKYLSIDVLSDVTLDDNYESNSNTWAKYFIEVNYVVPQNVLDLLLKEKIDKVKIESGNTSYIRKINGGRFKKQMNKMYEDINKEIEKPYIENF